MKTKFILLLSIVLLLLASCSKNDSRDDFKDFNKSEFDSYKKKWFEANIQNYSFNINYFSGSQGPQNAIITVENGENKSIENIYGNDFYRFKSINDIYNDIEEAYKRHTVELNNKEIRSIRIKIEYDSKLFYPKKVDYSIGYNTPIVGGYYYDFTISDFQITNE